MSASRRLPIKLHPEPGLVVSRSLVEEDKLVYIIVADRMHKYSKGRSRIAYIGTTKNGGYRVALSAAHRAYDILERWGVRRCEVRIITCKPRQKVRSWRKLERALLLEFRQLFGQPPTCNSHGKWIEADDEFEYFSKSRIRAILERLS